MSGRGTTCAEELVFRETWARHIEHRAERVRRALEFLDLCRETPAATETGAMRDARQWLEDESRQLLAVIANFPGWEVPE